MQSIQLLSQINSGMDRCQDMTDDCPSRPGRDLRGQSILSCGIVSVTVTVKGIVIAMCKAIGQAW